MKLPVKDIQGGQGAGKNIAIVQILKERAEEKPRTITVMTDTYDNLKDGAIKDFRMVFRDSGQNFDDYFNKTEKTAYYCGSEIQFRYISDVRENPGKSKRRDILYINEANKVGWTVASTYIGRTHEEVFIDYNPDFEFWAHTQLPTLIDKEGNVITEKLIVTYVDNEMCPQSEVDYIEARRNNTEWYRVYGLGEVGCYSDRRIYPEYRFTKSIPDTAIRINSAMDFGRSPDPTILVDMYVEGVDLYVDERFCMNNLLPEKIEGSERLSVVEKFDAMEFPKGHMVVADTDGKRTILDMIKSGYNVTPVKKSAGQASGIQKVRSYNLILTERSTNVKKGIEGWFWKVDHNGKIIPEPDGHEPDGLAAIRYGIMTYAK